MPKAAIRKGRIPALLGLVVHIIPLAAALSLIVLNIKTKFVGTGDVEVPLQFLAKFLELFAQASICNVVFTYVRLELIGQRPFPFGALFAGLSVTNLSYLWSPEFLGSITSSSLMGCRRLVFCLFIPFNVLLAAGIGPSIAITLIPRQQRFPAGMTNTWMNATSEVLYPMKVTTEHCHHACLDPRTYGVSPYMISCPFTDWKSVAAMRGRLKTLGPGILQHDAAVSRELREVYLSELKKKQLTPGAPTSSSSDTSDQIYVGMTTPSLPASQELVRDMFWWIAATAAANHKVYLELESGSFTLEAKQPISRVDCVNGTWSPSIGNGTFPLSNWSILPDFENEIVSAPEFNTLSPDSPHWQISWVDTVPTLTNYFALALVVPPGNVENHTEAGRYNALVCLVGAWWADSIIVWEISGDVANRDLPFLKSNITSIPIRTEDLVSISKDWAQLLTPTLHDLNISVLDVLMSSYGRDSVNQALDISVVNGMSQIGYNDVDYFDAIDEALYAEDVDKDWATGFITGGVGTNVFNASRSVMDSNYRATFRAKIDGTAYSTEGISVKIALAVLFIYCTYIIGFIIFTLIYSGHYSGAWDSIAELTALAMLSQPTEKLQHTSAGIETAQLFKEPVNIRAAGYDHLEIVFANDSGNRASDTVRENKEY